MADQFSEELVAYMKQIFNMFDRKGEGYINPQKLGVVMRCLGLNPTDAEIRIYINEVELDGHGKVKIDFPEFLTFMGRQSKKVREPEELRECFRIFDKHGTGYITAEELYYIMTHLGESLTAEELEELMFDADVAGDGRVNYEDFVTLITTK